MRAQAARRRAMPGPHAFDAEQRDAAQDEGRDGRRQVHAADIAAGGDGAVELRLREKIGEGDAADRVDAAAKRCVLQRLARLREILARRGSRPRPDRLR